MSDNANLPASLQVEVVGLIEDATPNARGRLDVGTEYVHGGVPTSSIVRHVIDIDSSLIATGIADISAVIGKAMEKASPDAWSVEFNVGFKAGLKVPVLLSGEANAALKVTLSWKSSKATV